MRRAAEADVRLSFPATRAAQSAGCSKKNAEALAVSDCAGAVGPSLLCYENTPQCSQSLTALSHALLYTLPIRCDASAGSEKGGAHH